MPLGYDIGVRGYRLAISLAAPFKKKAADWIAGRRGLWDRVEQADLAGCIWMHCASVGEFEQGLPILERLKHTYPNKHILVTFYSPSGYQAKKHHLIALHVDYLPLDTARNAKRFLELVQPSLALFVKYEFWHHFLDNCKKRSIPTYLVSAIFRKEQIFFKWYGGTARSMLTRFDRLFVQDENSVHLLREVGITQVERTGDTRFDRVAAIADHQKEIPLGKSFERASDHLTLVAGSTWPQGERMLLEALTKLKRPMRLLIAPHELGEERLDELEQLLPAPRDRWSRLQQVLKGLFNPQDDTFPRPDSLPNGDPLDIRSLLVDEMGLLSQLYKYGDIAYVGGGFGTGIHNTLEPAAHGKPILFGPNYARFAEAKGLIDAGAAWSVSSVEELQNMLQQMADDPRGIKTAGENAARYVEDNKGATERVVSVIELRMTSGK